MNLRFTIPNNLKSLLYSATVDFDDPNEDFLLMLMRPEFTYNSATGLYLKNFVGSTGEQTMTIDGTRKTITRDTGSFITDGLIVGNSITVSGSGESNTGPWTVSSISADGLTVYVRLARDGNGDPLYPIYDEVDGTLTISWNEEKLDAEDGYDRDLTATRVMTFTIDGNRLIMDPFDGSSLGTMPDVVDNSGGGIVYDSSVTDENVVCHITFSPWLINV